MKIIAFIFAVFLLVKPVLPILEYAAFYDYIKNELCINLDKPEMQCNGKCHLKKELAKVSNSEKDTEKNQYASVEHSLVFFQKIKINTFGFFPKRLNKKINYSYNNIYQFDYMGSIFHPPLV